MFLFPALPYAYDVLVAAVRSGDLSEERVTDAARHVLEFKARLNLHTGQLVGPTPTQPAIRMSVVPPAKIVSSAGTDAGSRFRE